MSRRSSLKLYIYRDAAVMLLFYFCPSSSLPSSIINLGRLIFHLPFHSKAGSDKEAVVPHGLVWRPNHRSRVSLCERLRTSWDRTEQTDSSHTLCVIQRVAFPQRCMNSKPVTWIMTRDSILISEKDHCYDSDDDTALLCTPAGLAWHIWYRMHVSHSKPISVFPWGCWQTTILINQ